MKTQEERNSMVNGMLGDNKLTNVAGGTSEIILPNIDPDRDIQIRKMLEEKLRPAGLTEEEIRKALNDFERRLLYMDVDTIDFPKNIF